MLKTLRMINTPLKILKMDSDPPKKEATGALEGRTATTHWVGVDQLRATGVTVEEARVVQDGKFWSGGGVTSGIDLAFAFIQSEAGRDMAGMIQLTMEYFPSQEVYAKKEQIKEMPPICAYEGMGKGSKPTHLPSYIVDNYFDT